MAHQGIPTTHAGTRFRSRLEARWAHLFDTLGWRWEYEPYDLGGYVPDFAILGPRPLIVEIKPALSLNELRPHVKKVMRADRDALIVGASPLMASEWSSSYDCAGLLVQWQDIDTRMAQENQAWSLLCELHERGGDMHDFTHQAIGEVASPWGLGPDDLARLIRAFGQEPAKARHESWVAEALWHRCAEEGCEQPSMHHAEGSWAGYPCNHYGGDHHLGLLPTSLLEQAWECAQRHAVASAVNPCDTTSLTANAHELIAWADGYQDVNEAGARRVRSFCNNALELINELEAERSARIAAQANYKRCLDLITSRAYAAAAAANSNGHTPP